jgi:EAL domain-containing protein (putative c-di-GMP-specific phosphodiesterase class I)/GGDEF domain-containing protein/CheY-like chemotaxis protein
VPESGAIPLVVLSRQQDPVEIINSTLRNAGHPVHCTWVRDVPAFADALSQATPQLLFLCVADGEETEAALEARKRLATRVPAILVREAITEPDLVRALELGAQDVVTLHARARLQAVASRELHASRLDNALAGTLASARQYRDQMKAFMTGSTDAIAHVQEGIVVDVNPAWIELFGHADAAALLGQPLMDFFAQASHSALKGALVAAAQGRWAGHALSARVQLPGGGELPIDLEFERFEFENEPAVRLRVATQQRDAESLARQLEEALRFDMVTGLLKRPAFHEAAAVHAAKPVKAGIRSVVYIEPDKYATLEEDLGPVAVESLMDGIGTVLRSQLQPGDEASRVTARGFAIIAERGNARDLDAWIARVLQRAAEHAFQVGDRSVTLTCSAGACTCGHQRAPVDAALETAITGCRKATAAGGNRLLRPEGDDGGADVAEADRAWATQIKAALMANRFRLVQQPIASLVGEGESMFDLVVRMLDETGNEVLPSEFLAAAQRTDLMKNIDRWVIGAAMSFCASRKPHRVFVRLSRDSMRDQTLGTWLHQQLKASGIEASRVVVELSEELATRQLKDAKELLALLRHLGFECAIENFGAGRNPLQLLGHLQVNYVKIDGSLMQGLANDRPLQEQVKLLVEEAKAHGITTIAERVEDANTMAVLWQLGIEFIQGYFVSSPEEVVLGA